MAFEQTRLVIGLTEHRQLTIIRDEMARQKNRQVTYSEAIGMLVTAWLAEHGIRETA